MPVQEGKFMHTVYIHIDENLDLSELRSLQEELRGVKPVMVPLMIFLWGKNLSVTSILLNSGSELQEREAIFLFLIYIDSKAYAPFWSRDNSAPVDFAGGRRGLGASPAGTGCAVNSHTEARTPNATPTTHPTARILWQAQLAPAHAPRVE